MIPSILRRVIVVEPSKHNEFKHNREYMNNGDINVMYMNMAINESYKSELEDKVGFVIVGKDGVKKGHNDNDKYAIEKALEFSGGDLYITSFPEKMVDPGKMNFNRIIVGDLKYDDMNHQILNYLINVLDSLKCKVYLLN